MRVVQTVVHLESHLCKMKNYPQEWFSKQMTVQNLKKLYREIPNYSHIQLDANKRGPRVDNSVQHKTQPVQILYHAVWAM